MADEDINDNFTGFRYLTDATSSRQYAVEFVGGEMIKPLLVFNGPSLKPNETVYALDDNQKRDAAGGLIATEAYQITADATGERYDIYIAPNPVVYKASAATSGNTKRYFLDVVAESKQMLRDEAFEGFPLQYQSAAPFSLPPHHQGGRADVARGEIGKLVAARKTTPSVPGPAPRPPRPARPPAPKKTYTIPDIKIEEALSKYGIDLTEEARAGRLDPVVGRDKEADQALKVLSRRKQSSLCFTGDAGVGKSAMFGAIAQRLVEDEANMPDSLQDARVVLLDLQSMNAGSRYRGDFEEKIKPLIEGLREREGVLKGRKVILAIDEIHSQLTAGAAEGGTNAGNMMKPFLASKGVSVMGTTTDAEYAEHIESDNALASRFEKTRLDSPNEDDTLTILKKLWPLTKEHNRLEKDLSEEELRYIITMTNRYAPSESQPRKGEKALNMAAASAEFEGHATIETNDIISAVAQMSGLSEDFLKQNDAERFLEMKNELPKVVIGQPGISKITSRLIGARSGLNNPNQPWGSFVLQGPSGTGKTETCKALARYLFGNEEALIQLNMADYQQEHDVSKITGAPPGYVGFNEPALTEQIRQKPYCILLLDELEKAHPKVFDKFLSVLNDGKMTDNHGRTVLFNNVIIVMTTNLGALEVQKLVEGKSSSMSFDKAARSPEKLQQDLGNMYKKAREGFFRPEMINRINAGGGFITFVPLEKEAIAKIATIEIDKISQRLGRADGGGLPGVTLEISEAVMQQICKEGYNPSMGARPLQTVVSEKISGPLGAWLLGHKDEAKAFVAKEGPARLVINSLDFDEAGEPTLAPTLVKAALPAVVNDNVANAAAPKKPAARKKTTADKHFSP